jgi:hypothetical protein
VANSVLKVQPTVESPETDLEQRGRLTASLTAMLADAYVLMVKTQGFIGRWSGRFSSACTN